MENVFREQVKSAILMTLVVPSAAVRTQVAQCVSAIAKIEIPRKEWLDLISNLATNSTNEQINIRHASLQPL